MSREIKFRIWCKGQDENLNFSKPRWIPIGDFILNKYYRFQDLLNEPNFEVMQWTGLVDSKGAEIYEGDIISADTEVLDFRFKGKARPKNVIGPIHFHHSYWAIGDFKLFIFDDETFEILGNIHENPELLK